MTLKDQQEYISKLEDAIQEKLEIQRAQTQVKLKVPLSLLNWDICMIRNTGATDIYIVIEDDNMSAWKAFENQPERSRYHVLCSNFPVEIISMIVYPLGLFLIDLTTASLLFAMSHFSTHLSARLPINTTLSVPFFPRTENLSFRYFENFICVDKRISFMFLRHYMYFLLTLSESR